MHYLNAWLTRSVFNLKGSESEPQSISGRLFQSLGAKCENALPPLVDLDVLPEFCDLKECGGLKGDKGSVKYTGAKPFRAL